MGERQLVSQAISLKEELLVVETEEMEDRGVELGDADAVFDRAVTELIGRTVHRAALSPPPAIQQVNPCGL